MKTCHPVSSGVSRMRSVALCPHGITTQIGQWNLPQGNLSLRSNVSSNYAQPTTTVTRTHQMHLVEWCELCHMVIVLKQMCRSWMCPRGTWELSWPRPERFFVWSAAGKLQLLLHKIHMWVAEGSKALFSRVILYPDDKVKGGKSTFSNSIEPHD